MKQIIPIYSFNKTNGQVTFTDFASIALERVLLVVNVTSGIVIYQFNDPTKLASAATNVLDLAYDTSAMANTDKLLIIYDVKSGDPTYDPTPSLASGAAAEVTLAALNAKVTAVNTGAVTVSSSVLPTGAALAANQQTNALTDTQIRATPVPVSGTITANTGLAQPLTDTQLRATPVPVSGTITATVASTTITGTVAATQSGTWTVSLPTGAATSANQSTSNSSLSSIDGKITAVNTGAVVLATGTSAFGKLAANSGVDIGDVDVTSLVPGTAASSLGKAEDAVHTTGDTGVFVLGVRNDTMADNTSLDGDYTALSTTSSGRVQVTRAPHGQMVRGTASTTGTTDTSVLAAAGALIKNYVTAIQVVNTGATASLVTIKDGAAGATIGFLIAPAGGGAIAYYDVPLITSANTAVVCTAATASTTIYFSVQGYKAP